MKQHSLIIVDGSDENAKQILHLLLWTCLCVCCSLASIVYFMEPVCAFTLGRFLLNLPEFLTFFLYIDHTKIIWTSIHNFPYLS